MTFCENFLINFLSELTLLWHAKPVTQFHKAVIAQAVAEPDDREHAAFCPQFFQQELRRQAFSTGAGNHAILLLLR